MGFKLKIPKNVVRSVMTPLTGGIKVPLPNGNKWDINKTAEGIVHTPGKELGNFATNWSLGLYGKGPKDFQNPGEDPNVTALRDRLFGAAQDFEKDLPGLRQSQYGQIEKEGAQALEQGLKGTRQNFNRRGLLYSGLREAGEQSARGRVASEMANQKVQVNQDLGKQAQAKYQAAAQAGLQGYQDAVNREAEIAGISLQNQVARAQLMQQLGATTGQIGALGYGASQRDRYSGQQYTGSWSDGPALGSEFRNGNLAADSYSWNPYTRT